MDSWNESCTVLVASCDSYADLQRHNIALLRKYWADCPFEIVLVTETALPVEAGQADYDRVIACGGGMNWASRLVRALDEVATPYVLMLCDDYFLESPVDTAQILKRLGQAVRFDALNLRLLPNPKTGLPREDGLMEYPKNTAYCISTLAGIWNRICLQNLARPVASIWEFERHGSFAVADERRPILATRTREFPFVDAVHKGCWEKAGVRVCEENGRAVDFARRGLPPFATRLKEGVKALVFAVFPWTLIVRVQNLLGVGMKEKGRGGREGPPPP